MAGKEYEVGGSIIHSANLLMTELLEETGKKIYNSIKLRVADKSLEKDVSHIYLYCSTGLHKKDNGKVEGEMRFSIVTKEGVVYQEHKSSILNTILMVWRYGLISLYKLNNYVGNMLDNFARY